MDQVWLFYEAAQKNIRHETLNFALAMRVAFGGDKNQWRKYVEALSSNDGSVQRILPKEKYRDLKRLLDGR